jgi:hypothetical protein
LNLNFNPHSSVDEAQLLRIFHKIAPDRRAYGRILAKNAMAITVRADPAARRPLAGPAKSIHAGKRFIYNERGRNQATLLLVGSGLLSTPAFTDAFSHH